MAAGSKSKARGVCSLAPPAALAADVVEEAGPEDSPRLGRRERDTATTVALLRLLLQVCAKLWLPMQCGQPVTVMVPTTGAADESAADMGVIGRHSLLPPPLLSELMIAAASLSSIKASSEAEIASAAGRTPSGIVAGDTLTL